MYNSFCYFVVVVASPHLHAGGGSYDNKRKKTDAQRQEGLKSLHVKSRLRTRCSTQRKKRAELMQMHACVCKDVGRVNNDQKGIV